MHCKIRPKQKKMHKRKQIQDKEMFRCKKAEIDKVRMKISDDKNAQ